MGNKLSSFLQLFCRKKIQSTLTNQPIFIKNKFLHSLIITTLKDFSLHVWLHNVKEFHGCDGRHMNSLGQVPSWGRCCCYRDEVLQLRLHCSGVCETWMMNSPSRGLDSFLFIHCIPPCLIEHLSPRQTPPEQKKFQNEYRIYIFMK